MLGPVGGKADLRDTAVVGPAGGDLLAPFGDLPCISTMSGCFGADLVELGPDQLVVVEVEPAGQRDLRPGGQQHLAVGALCVRR